jgi:EmrB/QacA subfamily drug resistance transporter
MTAQPLCDRAIALTFAAGRQRRPGLVLAVSILTSSLAFVDGSVVSVGLPAIGRAFHASGVDLQWIVNGYLLPLSALLLLGGALGDRFGRRRLLIIGVALFAIASAACAMAPSLIWLFLARGLQGAGAALMLPNSLAILGGAFDGEARGRAVGVWSASGSAAAAVGPVLGGWLIDTVGWPAVFLINLPLALGAIALALAALDPEPPAADPPPRLDLAGAVLITAALTGLTYGLTAGAGPAGWTAAALGAVLAGAALASAFVWVEKREGDRALTPLRLFGSPALVGLNVFTFLLYGVLAGFLLLIPYLLIAVAGYRATAAGAALLPFPIIMTIASPLAGGLAGRTGPRLPLAAGAVLVAIGLLLATRIGPSADYWTEVLPAVVVLALGMAGAAAPLTTAVLASAGAEHAGAASGLNSAVSRVGGVVATALLGAVLATGGAGFIDAFRVAALAGAIVALAAAASVTLLVPTSR